MRPDESGDACQLHLTSPALSLNELTVQVAQALEDADLWFGHGTDNPWDEACWLVASALQLDPLQPLPAALEVSDQQQRVVDQWLIRRTRDRLPLAYMTGEAWFAGLKFEVNPSVLIPRSPIAELITQGLPLWPLAQGDRVLDLCTGSGCIAVALARHFPHLQVVASDLSPEAVSVARRNAQAHQVSERCEVLMGDLFQPVSGKFALIISNPPYVSDRQYQQLPAEYGHEPGMALRCAGDGLDLPLKILHDAPDYLDREGQLILETGESSDALEQALQGVALTWLSFDHGGGGVLTATRDELCQWRPAIAGALEVIADGQ